MYKQVNARNRVSLLFENIRPFDFEAKEDQPSQSEELVTKLCKNAGVDYSAAWIGLLSVGLAIAVVFLTSGFLHPLFIPIYAIAAFIVPFLYLSGKGEKRSSDFAEDYPTVLLAMSSSIKSGLAPLAALERSARLLDKESLLKKEIKDFQDKIHKGVPIQSALESFGQGVTLPELTLFRTAFGLALNHGGSFAPILERLAHVSNDRRALTVSAKVTTSTMRMTGKLLVCITPILLLMVSLRSENYLEILTTHPQANFLASLGLTVIAVSIMTLRYMSSFKP